MPGSSSDESQQYNIKFLGLPIESRMTYLENCKYGIKDENQCSQHFNLLDNSKYRDVSEHYRRLVQIGRGSFG